jgi:hypothetical protein
MNERDETATAEQRRSNRKSLDASVTLRIESASVEGQGENISLAGMHIFTDQPLRVTVDVHTAGGPQTYRGRLIRVDRMSESNLGLAILFDPE